MEHALHFYIVVCPGGSQGKEHGNSCFCVCFFSLKALGPVVPGARCLAERWFLPSPIQAAVQAAQAACPAGAWPGCLGRQRGSGTGSVGMLWLSGAERRLPPTLPPRLLPEVISAVTLIVSPLLEYCRGGKAFKYFTRKPEADFSSNFGIRHSRKLPIQPSVPHPFSLPLVSCQLQCFNSFTRIFCI